MNLSSYPPPLRQDALGSPPLPRLLLEATLSRTGVFDGAWWPRSRHVRNELPDLVTALSAHLGSVLRVGLDTVAWDDVPRTVTVDGRVIRISWFSGCDWTISLTRGFQDHFLLLVVPAATDARTHGVNGDGRSRHARQPQDRRPNCSPLACSTDARAPRRG